jgi:hypothetical protein
MQCCFQILNSSAQWLCEQAISGDCKRGKDKTEAQSSKASIREYNANLIAKARPVALCCALEWRSGGYSDRVGLEK